MNVRALPSLHRVVLQAREREQARLELVTTACEVAVLTALMDQDLTPVSTHAGAEDLKHACWEHRSQALELLSPASNLHELSAEGLQQALAAFQCHLQDVHALRVRLNRLLAAHKHRSTAR